ncbi:MAG: UbiX family flavin prenyltransferase [Krumholzibacteria bacterium]|nr:UbiX family flavin prenyltransferase [Candidatus Krumholzibacteria bacterium]
MSAPQPAVGVGWTGASGIAYGVRLVEVLLAAGRDVHLVASAAVAQTAPVELGETLEAVQARLAEPGPGRLRVFGRSEFTSPLASGSARGGPFVVIPCSMGTVGRLAAGTSETLLLRAADVCLKERRPLILVPRETPMATHHLENLARLSALGALVLPAAPGFYHRPRTVEDLVDFVVQRVCDHLGVAVDLAPRWGDGA